MQRLTRRGMFRSAGLVAAAVLLFAASAAAHPVAADPAERATALLAHLTLKVVHPEAVGAEVLRAVAAAGGFPMSIMTERVSLKVPPARFMALLDDIAARGLVVERTLQREDLAAATATAEGRLRSKADIFARLRTFFDGASVQATLQVERNMRTLVEEIERVKGELRVLYDRAQWAVIDVSFQFRERQRIVYVSSPFEWLNSVDLDRFVQEY